MAGNGAPMLEGTNEKVENTPPPMEGKQTAVSPRAAVELPTPSGEARAADTIRSVFVARTAAASAASVGGFAQTETTDVTLAVRGAYCARLAIVEAEAVAVNPAAEGDVLRKACLARAVADAAQPRPKRRATSTTKRKKSATKSKRQVAPASASKAKKRSAKPRAAARRPPRGKRRGR
jgi:hypothetical protein